MENKKIIETIKELNKKLMDPESINLFVDFYERQLRTCIVYTILKQKK